MAIEKFQIDPYHSSFTFWVSHLGLAKTCFTFLKWTGEVEWDEADITKGSVSVQIEAESIESHNFPRDGHIRGEGWLDTARYPSISYKSTQVKRVGDHVEVTGDLTVREITKPVSLKIVPNGRKLDMFNFERLGFSATGSFLRKDFGVTAGLAEGGGIMAGAEVELFLEVEAVKGM